MRLPRRGLRRSLALAAVAVTLLGVPAAAQRQPLRDIEVDRIVAVVGTQPILFSEVLEAINFARGRGLQVPQDSVGQRSPVSSSARSWTRRS